MIEVFKLNADEVQLVLEAFEQALDYWHHGASTASGYGFDVYTEKYGQGVALYQRLRAQLADATDTKRGKR